MVFRPLPFRPRLVADRTPDADPSGVRASPPAPAPLNPAQAARFRETTLPHLEAAYNLARFLARDPIAAEDIVQEAFVRALRGFDGYGGGQARAWLLAIVRNCFFDWLKANRTHAALLVEPSDEAERTLERLPDPAAEDPEAALLRQADARTLRTMVDQLPEPFRQALVLREFEELSYREIGEATGAPIGTVMSRLARARRILADGLALSAQEQRL
jgi:RNA polymerase sigma factor (sigma-70 family)